MADISVIITFLAAYGAEMFQYCYFSSEITATVGIQSQTTHWWCILINSVLYVLFLFIEQYDSISNGVIFDDYYKFDSKSKKALRLFINIIDLRPMKLETVSIVRFELSLQLFLKVCQQITLLLWH